MSLLELDLALSWPVYDSGSKSYSSETFRTHDCSFLLKYGAQFSSSGNIQDSVEDEDKAERWPLIPMVTEPAQPERWLPYFLTKDAYPATTKEFRMSLPQIAEMQLDSLLKIFNLGPKLNVQDALVSELAAMCVWLLFTDVSPHFKEVVACTLAFISFGTSKDIKLPIDKTGVENLVGRILTSGNTAVQRQVCLALSSLAEFHSRLFVSLEFPLSAGIQDQLLQFGCNVECNPLLIYPLLGGIVNLSQFGKPMRKKFFEKGPLRSLLVKLLRGRGTGTEDESILARRGTEDESILAYTFRIVACIFCEGVGNLWDSVKETLSHHIPNLLSHRMTSVRPLRGFALAMQKIIKYGSLDQIMDVVDIDGVKLLLFACSIDDDKLVIASLTAIQSILRRLKGTLYYAMILCYEEWDVIISLYDSTFHNSRIFLLADDLLDKYNKD